jgi:hypothetical protein
MCDDSAEFTTITGTRQRVDWMMQQWEDLTLLTGERLWERGIRIRWYDLGDLGPEYRAPDCAAVAVALHGHGAARAAASISSALLLAAGGEPSGLTCEPGHYFTGDARSGGAGGAILDYAQLDRAAAGVPPMRRQRGSRVALIDTGDAASDQVPVDLTSGWTIAGQAGSDPHGHGSAVAAAIRTMAPDAQISPIQVLDDHCVGTSHAVYQGLIVALWAEEAYDVVNASLSVEAKTTCGTSLGSTFQHLMAMRAAGVNLATPPRLVVAAGNNVRDLRVPASVDGALVVVATDFAGETAPYCRDLDLPKGADAVRAPGGVAGDPLGHYVNGNEIYGTSFAAGLITGALLN